MDQISDTGDSFQWQPLWDRCERVLTRLNEAIPGVSVYGSVFVERRYARTFQLANLQKNIDSTSSSGIVMRIYDGFTLWESASDRFDDASLTAQLIALRGKVAARAQSRSNDEQPRPYAGAPWEERLRQPIEPEILAQLPRELSARTRVTFKVPYLKDPFAESDAHQFEALEALRTQAQQIAEEIGVKLDAFRAVSKIACDEMLFLDADVQMLQILPRPFRRLAMTSGKDTMRVISGGLGGAELLEIAESRVRSALADLLALSQAQPMVPGSYSVITSPEVSGVIAHEAFGHAQEGDTLARGRSQSHELRLSGESVGNDQATIWNHPGIFANANEPGAAWGSYFFDEEGWLAYGHPILDQGRLSQPMTHFLSALQLGVPRTANGKRESWMRPVYARQTNTYFTPGKSTLQELLQRMGDGFLADYAAGGMEDPKGLGIQVGIQFLREVRGGKLTGKLFHGSGGGSVQLTGYTPHVLNGIRGKSKISAETGEPDQYRYPVQDVGGCGKYHKESVRAGCGGPYLWLEGVQLG